VRRMKSNDIASGEGSTYKSNVASGIPEHHWTISFRGVQGVGKSRLASIVAAEISKRENVQLTICCMQDKVDSTLHWYDQNCSNYVHWKGITYGNLRKLKNHIVVIEDAPLQMRSMYRAGALQSLVTALSRGNRIFTIVTSQQPQKLPTALTVEMDVREGIYLYRVVEGRNATDWINWTANSEPKAEAVSTVTEAIYSGVKGNEIGRAGRPPRNESLRQQVFALLDAGMSIREIARRFRGKEEVVWIYHSQWKKRKPQY